MARRLFDEGSEHLERALVVPIPLHPLRRFERGYDQAAALAAVVARECALPLARPLRRVRWTEPQGSPACASRTANVSGVFAVKPLRGRLLRGRFVWLIDDVLTSGATASECARILRRGGAAGVGVLVAARATGRGGRGPAAADPEGRGSSGDSSPGEP
jgi:predicted amidophosphoribosyltransferase